MKQFYIAFIFIFIITSKSRAQIGPLEIIDDSSESTGISKIVSADLDQNGFQDIIVSSTGSNGKLGYYLNLGGGGFSSLQTLDIVPFSFGAAAGDFNIDGWPDLLLIGDIDQSAYLYWNNNGTFSGAVPIDSNISLSVNDIEVADFDSNGSDDFVIIGQHSIDYYRNDGSGNFTKEPILTTSTSPEVLECLDLATADFNMDGNLDLVCAETAGLVIYLNSGTGEFTPHYYSNLDEIGVNVHPFDIDSDGDVDVVLQNSAEEKKWYKNDGSGTFNFETNLSISPSLHCFVSADYNNDGLEDLFASYLNHISIFSNSTGHSFATEIPVFQDDNLYMDELALVDINNDGAPDYVWSGTNHTLAYHLNTNSLATHEIEDPAMVVYPNPSEGKVFFTGNFRHPFSLKIYNLNGTMVYQNPKTLPDRAIDLSILKTGIYLIEIGSFSEKYIEKLVVK